MIIIFQATEMSTTTLTPEPPVADDTQPTTPVEKTPSPSEEPVKVDSQQPDTEKKKERSKTPEAAPAPGGEGESGKAEKAKMNEAEAALDKELEGVSSKHGTMIYSCTVISFICRKTFVFRLYSVVVNSRLMGRRSQQPQ